MFYDIAAMMDLGLNGIVGKFNFCNIPITLSCSSSGFPLYWLTKHFFSPYRALETLFEFGPSSNGTQMSMSRQSMHVAVDCAGI